MFLVFGLAAVVMAIFNVICYGAGHDPKWFRFLSLSLSALTVCALYSQAASWVMSEDWSALSDVLPTLSKGIWILVFASVLLNGSTLFKKKG